jgi:ATP-binding cassette subfamily C protein CydCD
MVFQHRRFGVRAIRAVGGRSVIRRGALIASLLLVERLLAPAAAWAVFVPGSAKVLVLVLGGVHVLRNTAQRIFAARTESELFERSAAAALEGDVWRATLIPDDDARTKIFQAIQQTTQALSQELPGISADVGACVILGAAVAWHPPAEIVAHALALLPLAPLLVLVLFLAARQSARAASRTWRLRGVVYDAMVDVVDGRLEIVAGGLRRPVLADLRRRTAAWAESGSTIAVAAMLGGRVPLLAIALAAGAGLLGADASGRGLATLRDAAVLGAMAPAVVGLAQGLSGWKTAEPWVTILARVLEGARAAPARTTRPLPTACTRVQFESVSFRYDSESAFALRDLDFALDGAGAFAVAGPNGSGKTTCLRLLLGVATPTSGSVRVDGVPIVDVDADGWRERVAFMPQRPYLPPRSDVRTAVRWFAPGASDVRIREALGRVGLLRALGGSGQDPLEASVDELSVGQRQRVALARVLCRDARLYVLDEPDANLDREGIGIAVRLVRELAATHVVVFAAHSAELVEAADRVVRLGDEWREARAASSRDAS